MDRERKHIIEICAGIVSIVVGFVLYWWSMQLLWIAIYPPPFAKQIIEALPFVFWSIGVLLIVDGLRRTMLKERRKMKNYPMFKPKNKQYNEHFH